MNLSRPINPLLYWRGVAFASPDVDRVDSESWEQLPCVRCASIIPWGRWRYIALRPDGPHMCLGCAAQLIGRRADDASWFNRRASIAAILLAVVALCFAVWHLTHWTH